MDVRPKRSISTGYQRPGIFKGYRKKLCCGGKIHEREKKSLPFPKKIPHPIEEYIDTQVIEIANSTFGDVDTLVSLKNLLEKIQHCDEYKMHYVRDLAIARAIRRCDYEIEFSQTLCEPGEEEKLAHSLAKKYDLT